MKGTDAKGRDFEVRGGWLVVQAGAHQAARLAHVSWWRLGPDPIDEAIWCLDLAVGERLVKLYFDGQEGGLAWAARWLEASGDA